MKKIIVSLCTMAALLLSSTSTTAMAATASPEVVNEVSSTARYAAVAELPMWYNHTTKKTHVVEFTYTTLVDEGSEVITQLVGNVEYTFTVYNYKINGTMIYGVDYLP